jgi:hypothetical protein
VSFRVIQWATGAQGRESIRASWPLGHGTGLNPGNLSQSTRHHIRRHEIRPPDRGRERGAAPPGFATMANLPLIRSGGGFGNA